MLIILLLADLTHFYVVLFQLNLIILPFLNLSISETLIIGSLNNLSILVWFIELEASLFAGWVQNDVSERSNGRLSGVSGSLRVVWTVINLNFLTFMEQIRSANYLICPDDMVGNWLNAHSLILDWSLNRLNTFKCPPIESGVLVVDLVDVLDLI